MGLEHWIVIHPYEYMIITNMLESILNLNTISNVLPSRFPAKTGPPYICPIFVLARFFSHVISPDPKERLIIRWVRVPTRTPPYHRWVRVPIFGPFGFRICKGMYAFHYNYLIRFVVYELIWFCILYNLSEPSVFIYIGFSGNLGLVLAVWYTGLMPFDVCQFLVAPNVVVWHPKSANPLPITGKLKKKLIYGFLFLIRLLWFYDI